MRRLQYVQRWKQTIASSSDKDARSVDEFRGKANNVKRNRVRVREDSRLPRGTSAFPMKAEKRRTISVLEVSHRLEN